MDDSYFSATYNEARQRFVEAVVRIDADLLTYPIEVESQPDLAIDVALVGGRASNTSVVVISCGVHGVEGFLGSAIQLALLDRLSRESDLSRPRYVLIHGVNPYGFSNVRRFNEDNVDLNRNFLPPAEPYAGAPTGYADLNRLLNPQSPPRRFEPFKLKALWHIWRHGMGTLKESIASGQYDFPLGLFYGGDGPCRSTKQIQDHCDQWFPDSERIVHLDFHSGLGKYADCKLLLNEEVHADSYRWYIDHFGEDRVEPLTSPSGTAYRVTGQFGQWMQQHFGTRDYRFAGAEFGTYDPVRVLAAIRAENRAHHHGSKHSKAYQAAKRELMECFCPSNRVWRCSVVRSGLDLIDLARAAIEHR